MNTSNGKRIGVLLVGSVAVLALVSLMWLQRIRGPQASVAKSVVPSPASAATSPNAPVMPAASKGSGAAVGWSDAADARTAVHEAVAKMRARLGGKTPSYAIATFTV